MNSTDAAALHEISVIIAQARALIEQSELRIAQLSGTTTAREIPSLEDDVRIEKLGKVAWCHYEFIRRHKRMTLGDSLRIRRALYGNKVRGTANQFGKKDENALFYRTVDSMTKRADDQEVKISADGEQIALRWITKHASETDGLEELLK
ncbi:MAG TPA: hypothetical protein VMV90_03465 [Rectinemataceae bacterium]|nr:hypothetical protein [Rectinemataceae bacterium]